MEFGGGARGREVGRRLVKEKSRQKYTSIYILHICAYSLPSSPSKHNKLYLKYIQINIIYINIKKQEFLNHQTKTSLLPLPIGGEGVTTKKENGEMKVMMKKR